MYACSPPKGSRPAQHCTRRPNYMQKVPRTIHNDATCTCACNTDSLCSRHKCHLFVACESLWISTPEPPLLTCYMAKRSGALIRSARDEHVRSEWCSFYIALSDLVRLHQVVIIGQPLRWRSRPARTGSNACGTVQSRADSTKPIAAKSSERHTHPHTCTTSLSFGLANSTSRASKHYIACCRVWVNQARFHSLLAKCAAVMEEHSLVPTCQPMCQPLSIRLRHPHLSYKSLPAGATRCNPAGRRCMPRENCRRDQPHQINHTALTRCFVGKSQDSNFRFSSSQHSWLQARAADLQRMHSARWVQIGHLYSLVSD